MAIYKEAVRTSTLRHRVEVICMIPIPDVKADPDQAPAMGNSISEKEEKLEEFVELFMAPQYFRAMRSCISTFEQSELPIRLLAKQRVCICVTPRDTPGLYNHRNQTIYMDPDATIGLGVPSGEFIFGHEIGHKAMYVKDDSMWLLKEAAAILGMSCQGNVRQLEELIADEFGNLITGMDVDNVHFREPLGLLKREGIQRKILQYVWR